MAPTCFGLRPSSGSLQLSLAKFILILKHSVRLRLYLLCGGVAACPSMACVLCAVQSETVSLCAAHSWNRTLQVMLTACQQAVSITCMTYTYCCVYSARLLMMDRETVRNMQSSIPKNNSRNQLLVLQGYITMHGPLKVKFRRLRI